MKKKGRLSGGGRKQEMIWEALKRFEATDFATWVREGDIVEPFSTFYTLLGAHSIGMAAVVGICWIVSVRIFGFHQTLSLQAANQLMRVGWWGFYLNFASGMILLSAQPRRELLTGLFWVKIAFIVMAVISMLVMQKALARIKTAPNPDPGGPPVEVVPINLRLLAFALDMFWIIAIVAGRLIGYTQPPPPL